MGQACSLGEDESEKQLTRQRVQKYEVRQAKIFRGGHDDAGRDA